MKAYAGVDIDINIYFTSAFAGGELSASRSGHFTPGKEVPGTHWMGRWMDPTAGLDDLEKWTFLTLSWLELRPLGLPARSQSLYWLQVQIKRSFISRLNTYAWKVDKFFFFFFFLNTGSDKRSYSENLTTNKPSVL
jgi:hypothetical protein